MTINEAISFKGQLTSRLAELKQLRDQVSTKETRWMNDQSTKLVEPQYDVKKVDLKIVQIQNWLFKIDSAIKKTNAITDLGFDIPADELLSPLE
jgi:hypothetical protein